MEKKIDLYIIIKIFHYKIIIIIRVKHLMHSFLANESADTRIGNKIEIIIVVKQKKQNKN